MLLKFALPLSYYYINHLILLYIGLEFKAELLCFSCAGVCCYEGRGGLCSIRLSTPLLKLRPRKDLVETLLHEMIHAYLFITQNNRDRDGHGPEFQKHMHRINAVAKTNITVGLDSRTLNVSNCDENRFFRMSSCKRNLINSCSGSGGFFIIITAPCVFALIYYRSFCATRLLFDHWLLCAAELAPYIVQYAWIYNVSLSLHDRFIFLMATCVTVCNCRSTITFMMRCGTIRRMSGSVTARVNIEDRITVCSNAPVIGLQDLMISVCIILISIDVEQLFKANYFVGGQIMLSFILCHLWL